MAEPVGQRAEQRQCHALPQGRDHQPGQHGRPHLRPGLRRVRHQEHGEHRDHRSGAERGEDADHHAARPPPQHHDHRYPGGAVLRPATHELRCLLDPQPDPDTDADQDDRRQERQPPPPGQEVLLGQLGEQYEGQVAGEQRQCEAHRGPAAEEAPAAGRAVFGAEQHRASPFAADADALRDTQCHQQDRREDTGRVIGGQQADAERGDAHDEQRPHHHRLAAHPVAEVAEQQAAQRARDEPGRVGGERREHTAERSTTPGRTTGRTPARTPSRTDRSRTTRWRCRSCSRSAPGGPNEDPRSPRVSRVLIGHEGPPAELVGIGGEVVGPHLLPVRLPDHLPPVRPYRVQRLQVRVVVRGGGPLLREVGLRVGLAGRPGRRPRRTRSARHRPTTAGPDRAGRAPSA